MAVPTRKSVHDGIAAYFGGTYQPDQRCWQHGPLVNSGLGTVRKGWPKKLDDADLFAGMVAGRGMGCFMIVEMGTDREMRLDVGGPPATDTNGNLIAGGTKQIRQQVTLHCFHMAQKQYGEDAADDIDQLIESIKHKIRIDRTLGGICTQAGEGRFGIVTSVGKPGMQDNRTFTWFTLAFECLVIIIG